MDNNPPLDADSNTETSDVESATNSSEVRPAETTESKSIPGDEALDINPPLSVDDKTRRLNLINRRSTAYLIEATAFAFLVYPIFWALFLHLGIERIEGGYSTSISGTSADSTVSASWFIDPSTLIFLCYWLIRDLIGTASWAKRLVGLELKSSDGSPITAGRKLLRNLTLMLPLVALIEFFIAYHGNHRMMRWGDKWGKTYVDAIDRNTIRGKYQGKMVLALILNVAVAVQVTPMVTKFYLNIFAGMPSSIENSSVKTFTSDLGYTIDLPEALVKNVSPFTNTATLTALESTLYRGGQSGNLLLRAFEVTVDINKMGGADALKDGFLKELGQPPYGNLKHQSRSVEGRLEVHYSGLKTEEGQTYAVAGKLLFTHGKRFYWLMGVWLQNNPQPEWIKKSIESFALTFPPNPGAAAASQLSPDNNQLLREIKQLADETCACEDSDCLTRMNEEGELLFKRLKTAFPTKDSIPVEMLEKVKSLTKQTMTCVEALRGKLGTKP